MSSKKEEIGKKPIEDKINKNVVSEEDYIVLLNEVRKTKTTSQLKSSFLMNIGQEIRTPLIALKGYTDILEKQVTSKNNIECVNSLKEVFVSFEEILNEIVTISKIEGGSFHFSKQAIDINKFCYNIHNAYSEEIKDKGIQFFFNFPVDLPIFFADQIRLKQILMNLINNSIRYTKVGSIHLFISLKQSKNQNIPMLNFCIEDTGPGIDSLVLKKMQQALSGSMKVDCVQSLGFGLSICLNLLVLMDGTISIESNVGEGTSVDISIPFKTSTEKNTKVRSFKLNQNIISLKPYNNKEIILFSNSIILFDELRKTGISIGLNTVCIQNKTILSELIKNNNLSDFFALFFDNDDFDIDEFEIKKLIKKEPLLKNLPLFIITSYRNNSSINKKTSSGSLIRPINIQNLSSILQPFTYKKDEANYSIPENILVNAQKEILPQLNTLGGGYPIQEIKSIALNIYNFAKRENISLLADLSEILKDSADNFDVQKIERTLNEIKSKLSR